MDMTRLGVIVSACGAFLIAVCLYYDYHRHKDPDFRKKLKARRKIKKAQEETNETPLIKFDDPREQQIMILQEIQVAEGLMNEGNYEKAILHFANAVALCADPSCMVRALRATLPSTAYVLLKDILIQKHGYTPSQIDSM